MKCNQLSGSYDIEFHAETFEGMTKLSQQHDKEMFQNGDTPHLAKLQEMMNLKSDPNAMQK